HGQRDARPPRRRTRLGRRLARPHHHPRPARPPRRAPRRPHRPHPPRRPGRPRPRPLHRRAGGLRSSSEIRIVLSGLVIVNIEAFSSSANGELVRESDSRYGEYIAFVPHDLPLVVNLSPELIMALSSADRSLGELAGEGRHLLNPGLLVNPLLRREAVLSVRIEGTRTHVADLYAYDAGQLSLFGDDAHDRVHALREAQNYERALKFGINRIQSNPDARVTIDLLCELHAMLLAGTRDAGRSEEHTSELQ